MLNLKCSTFIIALELCCAAVLIFWITTDTAAAAPFDADTASNEPSGAGLPLRVGSGPGCTHSTIQAAIDSVAVGGSAEIRVTASPTFNEAVSIVNRNITLIGGYENCLAQVPSSFRSAIVAPSGSRPMRVSASGSGVRNVRIRNFFLRDGSVSAPESGGGVWATASGSAELVLTFDRAWITNNSSSIGGGVHLQTLSATSQIRSFFVNDSQIDQNTAATRGGGLLCSGPGTGQITMTGGTVRGNQAGTLELADGEGGGIALDGCSLTWFSGLPSPGTELLRSNAVAGKGGGIWAVDGAEVDLRGYLFVSEDPFDFLGFPVSAQPMVVQANFATGPTGNPGAGQGAGIWLSNANLSASATWFMGNSAAGNGGAIYAINGAQVDFNRDIRGALGGLSSAPCHEPVICSYIFGNGAQDTGGAIYLRDADTFAQIDRTVIAGNLTAAITGASLFAQVDSHLRVSNSLLIGFESDPFDPQYVFWVGSNARVDVFWSTITNKQPGNAIFRFGSSSSELTLRGSIIHDPGVAIGFTGGTSPTVNSDCVLWHSDELTQAPYTFVGSPVFHILADPEFVDPADFDFSLRPQSPAIDFCDQSIPPGVAPDTDLALNPRGVLTSGALPFRPYDLGALEYFSDRIFSDRFQ